MHEPTVWSWPTCRAELKEADKTNVIEDENDDQVSSQQLQSWIGGLEFAGGELLVSADTLELLPGRMPYEVFGACLLAAVDSQATAAAQHANSSTGSDAVEQSQQQQQQQHHVALKLHRIDLQEPISGPLTTCFTGYPLLQHLSLQELNVDADAAAALGNIMQQTSCSQGNGTNSSGHNGGMKSLTLHSVFLCQLAWQGLVRGLGTRCQLHTLRLKDCLNVPSLTLLAHALPDSCSSLQHLDLSCNMLKPQQLQTLGAPARGSSCAAVDSSCDQAWAQFLTALDAPACCPQLHVLVLDRCSLGPAAAAALAQVLSARCRSNLQQLSLAHCQLMGEVAVERLSAAVRHHPSLAALDMSCNSLSDQCVAGMLGSSSGISGWWRQQRACQQLRRLCLAGNTRMTAAALVQLARIVMSGGVVALRVLDVAQCPHLGNDGALAMASCILSPQCHLLELNMSGCEITDAGAAALAAALGQNSSDSMQTVTGTPADCSVIRSNSSPSHGGGESGSKLLELRLADNQITAIGLQALAEAISHQSCGLRLLDVSFNWAGPEAMRPLTLAAERRSQLPADWDGDSSSRPVAGSQGSVVNQQAQHSMQKSTSSPSLQPRHVCEPLPGITVLRECAHEWWRVEAAKASARAAAAADVAAVAAAEAAAAAAAAGSSWEPDEHAKSLPQRVPAAAAAVGITGSSYQGPGSCCSSVMTHAGSLTGSHARSPCTGGQATGSAVWLFNGLYAAADDFGSPDSTGAAACDGDTLISRWHRRSSSGTGHSAHLTTCGVALQTSDQPVDHKAFAATSMGSHNWEPGVSGAEGQPCCVATRTAALSVIESSTAAVHGASAAPSCLHIPGDSDGDGSGEDSSSTSDCMQQEASFKYQIHDDVVHSPTRYDQQLQEQQQHLKGVPWSEEFSLSPPKHSDLSTCAHTSPNLPSGSAGLGALERTCASAQSHSENCRTATKTSSYADKQLSATDTHHSAHDATCASAGASDGSQHTTAAAAAVLGKKYPGLLDNQVPLSADHLSHDDSHHAATGERASGVSPLTSTDRQTATIRARPPDIPRRPRCGLQVRLSSQSTKPLTRAVSVARPVSHASRSSDIESHTVCQHGGRGFRNNMVEAGQGASLEGAVMPKMLAQRTAVAANAPAAPISSVPQKPTSCTWGERHGTVQPGLSPAAAAAAGGVASTLPLLPSLTSSGAEHMHPTAGAAAVTLHTQPATSQDCSPDSVKSNGQSGVNFPLGSSTRSARSAGPYRSARPRISTAAGCHTQHVAACMAHPHLQQQYCSTVVAVQAGQCSTAAALSETADGHNSASCRITSSSSPGVVAFRADGVMQQQQQQSERLLAKATHTCNSEMHGIKAVASSSSLWQDLLSEQHDGDAASGHAQPETRHGSLVVSHAGNHLHALPVVGW